MPLYEYRCDACGSRFELIRKFSDAPLEVCPTCGAGPVQKLISSPAFQFKGSGFYATDYARKSSGEASGEKSGGEKSEGEKSGGGESKSDAKPSTGTDTGSTSSSSSSSSSGDSSARKESGSSDKPAATPSSKDS